MMNVFRAVIFACVMGMVHGQTYIFTDSNISSTVTSCFDNNNHWKTDIAPCDDVSNWDVSRVTDMNGLFMTSTYNTFDEDISAWDVSSVTSMISMFENAHAFNQPLNNWNVSSVQFMDYMFFYAVNFNQPLNDWDVSSVTSMGSMFGNAHAFNQTLDNWDVSSVNDMHKMFYNTAFNHTISCWDLHNEININAMFLNSPAALKTHYVQYGGFTYHGDPEATFASKNNPASDCVCGVGTYVTNNTVSPPECGNCAAGKYSNEGNLAACKDCPIGFYQSEAGQSSCVACPADKTSFAGSTQCYTPTEMFTTLGADVVDCDIKLYQRFASDRYFQDEDGNACGFPNTIKFIRSVDSTGAPPWVNGEIIETTSTMLSKERCQHRCYEESDCDYFFYQIYNGTHTCYLIEEYAVSSCNVGNYQPYFGRNGATAPVANIINQATGEGCENLHTSPLCPEGKVSFAGSTQCYTPTEMFNELGKDVSRQDIVNLYNSRNFSTCSS